MENKNSESILTEKVIYTALTHTTGGRDGGSSQSSDGKLNVQLAVPGSNGTGTNPEQLFAAGWSACFIGAMKKISAGLKVKFPADASVNAEVDLLLSDDGYTLKARLNVILPGLDEKTSKAIADGAHQICPYSKATRGNIDVTINLA
jgi:osmotically inducible protein OsmC